MKQEKWLLCPVCGNKTRLKLKIQFLKIFLYIVQSVSRKLL